MPRIKRWFPVSHDINGDPEVWELTDRFGERALRVWLEILSVSDRNEGEVKGQRESILTTLSSKLRTTRTKVSQILEYAESKGWLVSNPTLRVCNYEKYKPRRVQKEHPQGSITSSLLPSPPLPVPTLQVQEPEKAVGADPSGTAPAHPQDNGLPDWFKEALEKSPYFQDLAIGHAKFWQAMSVAYDPYEWLKWDEEIQKADAWIAANPQRRPRALPRFLRNWFERAVERRRKEQHAKGSG